LAAAAAPGLPKRRIGIERPVMLARAAMTETTSTDAVLASYRASIDNIDAALIHILAERFRITKAVGAYKAEMNLPASDPGREERQIARLRALAVEAQLDPEFSEKFLRFIIQEVIRHHEQAQGKAPAA
jgi:chorismate mutase